jgi:hypothetical protein
MEGGLPEQGQYFLNADTPFFVGFPMALSVGEEQVMKSASLS